ncbi:hypothetical protein HELRODRAFT_171194 [Helobdella robusta]|uniref:Receptor ligand binding region domain-containing protein n=1 Tax=Helobdella robusta TaxID=6412 RepID=T1F3X3_HELRO|nr:hypothetical protein HELRODRAFT_171194 [Helobdella robusta]ESO05554.1 hypothetical protein HELRODRAFT_171194 [Helobdella robusta]
MSRYNSVLMFSFITYLIKSWDIPNNMVQIGLIVSDEDEDSYVGKVQNGYWKATNQTDYNISYQYNLISTTVNVCDRMSGTRAAMHLFLNQSADVIIGSFCSANCVSSAQVADYWDLPYFALDCIDPALDNSTLYSSAIRLIGSLNAYGSALLAFFMRNNWKSCAIVKEVETDFCQYAMNALRNKFRGSVKISEFLEITNVPTDDEVKNLLKKIELSARNYNYTLILSVILVCHTNPRTTMNIIGKAYRLGMADPKEYAWITLYNIYSNFSFDTLFVPWQIANDPDEKDKMRKAFLSVKVLTYKNYTRLPDPGANLPRAVTSKSLQMDILTDSVFMFFSVMSRASNRNLNPLSGRNILNLSRNLELNGGDTEAIKMNADGDRFMTFVVWSLAPDSTMFRPFININFTDGNYTPFLVDTETWGYASSPPIDTPICSFDNKLCPRNDNAIIIGLAVLFVLLILSVVLAMSIRSRVNEQKIQSMTWKIRYNDLRFFKTTRSMKSMSRSSDMNESEGHIFPESFREFEDSMTGGVTLALYKGDVVTVNYSGKREIVLSRKDLVELVKVSQLQC